MPLYERFGLSGGRPRNLIQAPEVGRKVARGFGIRETNAVTTVVPEIYPVAVIADFAKDQAEDLEVERPCYEALVMTAINTDIATVWHFGVNPGLDIIAIVDEIICSGNVANTWTLHDRPQNNTPPAGATVGEGHFRHMGINAGSPTIASPSACTFQAAVNTTAGGAYVIYSHAPANTPIRLVQGQQIYIPPGKSIRIQAGGGINANLACSIYWRERRLTA